MNNPKYLLIGLLLLLENRLFAQNFFSDSTKKNPIILTAFLYYRNSPLSFGTANKNTAYYVSNNRYVLKLGVVIRGVALRWGIPLPVMTLNNQYSLFSYTDIHGNYSKSPFIFDIDFRRGKQFSSTSLTNNLFSQDISDNIRNDIKTFDVAFWAAYTFSKDFDYNTAFKNLRPIDQDVICPYVGIRSQDHYVKADSSLFTSSYQTNDNSLSHLQKIGTSDFTVNAGFVAAATRKKWFIAAIVGAGAGFEDQKWTDVKYNHRVRFARSFDMRANIGYNTDNYFLAFSTYFDSVFVRLPQNSFHYNPYLCLSLNYGYRLKKKI